MSFGSSPAIANQEPRLQPFCQIAIVNDRDPRPDGAGGAAGVSKRYIKTITLEQGQKTFIGRNDIEGLKERLNKLTSFISRHQIKVEFNENKLFVKHYAGPATFITVDGHTQTLRESIFTLTKTTIDKPLIIHFMFLHSDMKPSNLCTIFVHKFEQKA